MDDDQQENDNQKENGMKQQQNDNQLFTIEKEHEKLNQESNSSSNQLNQLNQLKKLSNGSSELKDEIKYQPDQSQAAQMYQNLLKDSVPNEPAKYQPKNNDKNDKNNKNDDNNNSDDKIESQSDKQSVQSKEGLKGLKVIKTAAKLTQLAHHEDGQIDKQTSGMQTSPGQMSPGQWTKIQEEIPQNEKEDQDDDDDAADRYSINFNLQEKKYFIYQIKESNFVCQKECVGNITVPVDQRLTLHQLRSLMLLSSDESVRMAAKRRFKYLAEFYKLIVSPEQNTVVDDVYPTQGIFIKVNLPGEGIDYQWDKKWTDKRFKYKNEYQAQIERINERRKKDQMENEDEKEKQLLNKKRRKSFKIVKSFSSQFHGSPSYQSNRNPFDSSFSQYYNSLKRDQYYGLYNLILLN